MKKLQHFDQNLGLNIWKNANFAVFLNPCSYHLERLGFKRERHHILFLHVFWIKRKSDNMSIMGCY